MAMALLLALSAVADVKDSKSVHVQLTSDWAGFGNIHLEVLEYLHDEADPTLMWRALETWQHSEAHDEDEERYNRAVENVSRLLSPTSLAMLKLYISARFHVVRVHAFTQEARNSAALYNTSQPVWIEHCGRAFLTIEDFDSYMDHGFVAVDASGAEKDGAQATECKDGSPKSALSGYYHHHPMYKAADGPLVVLHADVGSADSSAAFRQFHDALKRRCEISELR